MCIGQAPYENGRRCGDLPMQSVHIANKIASSIHTHSEVYSIQHYVINFITALLYDYCIPCVFILFTKQKATTPSVQ
jgi:hypothetical protein